MADKNDKKILTSGTVLPNLTDILKRNGDTKKSDHNYQDGGIRNNVSTTPETLDELLKKGYNKRERASKTKSNSDATPSKLPGIEAFVKTAPHRKSPKTKTPTHSHKSEKTLHQIISSSKPEDIEQQTNHTAKEHKRRKALSFTLIALLVITVVSLFMTHQKQQLVPESALAQQLISIVNGLEKYRLDNNQLPEQLSELPEFPEDAVEWRVDQYDIQLEARALELFFLEDATGFIVISRYDNEAWMYIDKGTPKIRRVPAR